MNILSKSESQFRVSDSQRRREAVPAPAALRRSSTNETLSLAQSKTDSRTGTVTGTSSHPAREEDDETLASEDLNTVVTDNWSEFGNIMAAASAIAVIPSGASVRNHPAPPARIGMDFASESKDPGWKTTGEVAKRRMEHNLGVTALLTLLKPEDFQGTGLVVEDQEAVVRALDAHDLRSRLDAIWYGCLKVRTVAWRTCPLTCMPWRRCSCRMSQSCASSFFFFCLLCAHGPLICADIEGRDLACRGQTQLWIRSPLGRYALIPQSLFDSSLA
jgi:hypothetical protein